MAVEVAQLDLPKSPAPSLFISTPIKDLTFYFASVSVVLIAWFAATVLHVDSLVILATVAVVANGPHLVSTWTRVYFDKREWRERPFLIIGMPLAIATAVTLLTLFLSEPVTVAGVKIASGPRILNSTILYWATWHFVAQNWGILRIYQRKSGEALTSVALRLEQPILYLFVLWCLLKRIDTGPRTLFGTEVIYYRLPSAVVDGLWGPLGFLIAVYLWQRIRERNQPWAKAAAVRGGFLLCAFIGFFVPFQCTKTDDTSAFAAAACWHGIQYLGIVRHYHRNTWKGGVHPDAKLISWLSQPGKTRFALYAALLLALAGSGYLLIFALSFASSHLTVGASAQTLLIAVAALFAVSQLGLWLASRKGRLPMIGVLRFASFVLPALVIGGLKMPRASQGWNEYTWAAVVWISLTLSHYWLDGVIWKLRKPELARRVGL